ncbi:MAG: HlyD family efflux transporter periplasmic adaptor subunit [Legionellaceae bacterium]|nr:HlyD family efflux transporter periplasmic adaptor subunit [Legionellaceae bacterium]
MRVYLSIFILSITTILTSCDKPRHKYQGYIEGENIYLESQFPGKLMKMFVSRGSKVKKGDLLFVLDPKPQRFLLDEAGALYVQGHAILADLKKPKRQPELDTIKAQIAQANAQLALAELRVKRNTTLYSKHVLDKDSLDATVEHLNEIKAVKSQFESHLALAELGARQDQITAQEAQMTMLGAKMKAAQWQAQEKRITAPTDGVIYDIYYRKGEYVVGTKPMAALLAPQNIYIEFFVPLDGMKNLKIGQKIGFSYENDTKLNPAVITYVSPEAEYMPPLVYSRENSDKIVFRVKAKTKPTERLLPGQPVVITVADESDHAR